MTKHATPRSVKGEVIQLIRHLPDDVTLAEIRYHLAVRAKIEKCLQRLDDGQFLTQDEVEETVIGWFDSPSPPTPDQPVIVPDEPEP